MVENNVITLRFYDDVVVIQHSDGTMSYKRRD